MNDHKKIANLQKIYQSGSYKKAHEDVDFLQWDELRPLRLQLELMKPELIMNANNIKSTIVVFGSARLRSPQEAEHNYRLAKSASAAHPNESAHTLNLIKAEKNLEYSNYYEEARKLSQLLSDKPITIDGEKSYVVTGGGPGIMEAANRGAFEKNTPSIGLNITLEHEQVPNAYIAPELCFQFQYFAIRKMHFLLRAKAMIAFPGGFGTFDEVFETLTLIQTKRMPKIPVYLFGEGFWSKAINFDFLVESGVISEHDLDLFTFVETAEETWQHLKNYFSLGIAP